MIPNKNDRDFYDLDGTITHETSNAILVRSGPDSIWIPKSQLGDITYCDGGDSTEVRVGDDIEAVDIPRWLAVEKGLA